MKALLVGQDSSLRNQLRQDLDTDGLEIETAECVDSASADGHECGYAVTLLCPRSTESMMKELRDLRDAIDDPILLVMSELDTDGTEPCPDPQDTTTLAAALDAGADDAIAAPYDKQVLIARVRALVRRCGAGEESVLRFEDLELDYAAHRVTRQGREVRLTAKEFDLLTLFMTHQRQVLSREEIAKHAWDRNFDAFSNVIEVIISRLRKKIDQPFDVPYLHTVVGRGYMLSITPPTGEE